MDGILELNNKAKKVTDNIVDLLQAEKLKKGTYC